MKESYYILELSNNKKIICYPQDKIKLGNGNIEYAKNLKSGMIIETEDGLPIIFNIKNIN